MTRFLTAMPESFQKTAGYPVTDNLHQIDASEAQRYSLLIRKSHGPFPAFKRGSVISHDLQIRFTQWIVHKIEDNKR